MELPLTRESLALRRPTVVVTGASGFVGGYLVKLLVENSYSVLATSRFLPRSGKDIFSNPALCGPKWLQLLPDTDSRYMREAMEGVDAVVHLAGRAHVMRHARDERTENRVANTDFTQRLAAAANDAGVRRFVYSSTVKVLGDRTSTEAFGEGSRASPVGPYAESKLLAEQALQSICARGSMDFVIIRPTMVVGAGARGNLERIAKWIRSGIPMPLKGVNNLRSIVAVETLAEILMRSITALEATNRILLAAEPSPLSTKDMVRAMAAGMGKRVYMFSLSEGLVKVLKRLPGIGESVMRLYESLEVDATGTYARLGWRPSINSYSRLERLGHRIEND